MDKSAVIVAFWAFCCVTQGHLFAGDHLKKFNFYGQSVGDGITTLRIAYDGNLGIETFAESVGENGLFMRQATDTKQLVKLVYSRAGMLMTCDIIKDDPEEMLRFLKYFLSRDTVHKSDLRQDNLISHLKKQGNFTWSVITEENQEVRELVDISGMMSQCIELVKTEQQKVKAAAVRARSDQTGKTRQKREGDFIYPGTLWCGRGSDTVNYEDLGVNSEVDKCCRTHDLCPQYIEGFTTKYGYYNYRFTTVSHCDCDERFRTCLKYRNSPVADNLGEIFFNKLASKCFTVQPVRVCTKKSFWGRCTEYSHDYKAVIHDPLEY